jgi:hypothetical protein
MKPVIVVVVRGGVVQAVASNVGAEVVVVDYDNAEEDANDLPELPEGMFYHEGEACVEEEGPFTWGL